MNLGLWRIWIPGDRLHCEKVPECCVICKSAYAMNSSTFVQTKLGHSILESYIFKWS